MRVLFLTVDRVGRQRAGTAIRCWELAQQVARQHEVTLASFHPSDIDSGSVHLLPDIFHRRKEFQRAVQAADILFLQGPVLASLPLPLRRRNKFLVSDLCGPYLLEYLSHPHPSWPRLGYLRQWHLLNEQLAVGDFFLCSNERQRDYWLGRLCALGRLNPQLYACDPTFRQLLEVVPFGITSQPPQHTRPILRGVLPEIGNNDRVLLWGGGLWEWLDPMTVVRAVAEASAQHPEIKLVFICTQHPRPGQRDIPILGQTRQLARNLGVLNRSVFFLEGWVAFEDRPNYLLEADVGLSAHYETAEMRLASRVRVLDYIWAGLPMILTRGDHFSDWVEREQVGVTVAPGDVAGWKQAIFRVTGDPQFRQRCREKLQSLAKNFYWETVAEPLLRYCDQPYHTARASAWFPRMIPLLTSGYWHWLRAQRLIHRLRQQPHRNPEADQT